MISSLYPSLPASANFAAKYSHEGEMADHWGNVVKLAQDVRSKIKAFQDTGQGAQLLLPPLAGLASAFEAAARTHQTEQKVLTDQIKRLADRLAAFESAAD